MTTLDSRFARHCLVLLGLPYACSLVADMPDDPRFGSGSGGSGGGGGAAGVRSGAGEGGSGESGTGGGSGEPGTGTGGMAGGGAGGVAGTSASGGDLGDAGAGEAGRDSEGGAGSGGGGDGAGSGGDDWKSLGKKPTVVGSVFVLPDAPKSIVPVSVLSRRRDSLTAPDVDVAWLYDADTYAYGTYRAGRFGPGIGFTGPVRLAAQTPVMVSPAADRVDLFYVDESNGVWTRAIVRESPQRLFNVGGDATRGIAAAADVAALHVFAVSADGTVQHVEKRLGTVGYPAWETFEGARSDGGIAAVTQREGNVTVFIRDQGVLYQKWLIGGAWYPANGWQPITPSGAPCTSVCPCNEISLDLTVTSSGPERVDVTFFSDTLFNLRWRATDGWQCERFNALMTTRPAAAVRDTHRFDLFWAPPTGEAVGKSWHGAKWSPEYSLGATFTDVAAASTGPDTLFVFGRLSDQTIAFRMWTSTDGWLPKPPSE